MFNPEDLEGEELLYHCIERPKSAQDPKPLRPYQVLSASCRDDYFEKGSICTSGSTTKFDLAWTWVNGSDSLLHEAMYNAESKAGHEEGVGSKAGQKLYRCVDTLPLQTRI